MAEGRVSGHSVFGPKIPIDLAPKNPPFGQSFSATFKVARSAFDCSLPVEKVGRLVRFFTHMVPDDAPDLHFSVCSPSSEVKLPLHVSSG
jgi:hypothetical protein